MGRPATYEVDGVLRGAVALFLSQGFHSTSIRDLVRATGINRFAIYEKFGGKEELFYAALSYYVAVDVKQNLLGPLMAPDATMESLLSVLRCMRTANLDPTHPAGCPIFNAFLESGGKDEKLKELVREFLGGFRAAALNVLCISESRGQLVGNRSPEARAEHLLLMLNAFMVMPRMSRSAADKLIGVIIREVESWCATSEATQVA